MLPALLGYLTKSSAVKCAERIIRRQHDEGDALLPREADAGHDGDEIDNASGSPDRGSRVCKAMKLSRMATRRYTCCDDPWVSEHEDQKSQVGKQWLVKSRSRRLSQATQDERTASLLTHEEDMRKMLSEKPGEWGYDDMFFACVVLTDVICMGVEGQWKPCQYAAMASVYLAFDAITISLYVVYMGMLVHREGTSWVKQPLNWLDCILNIIGVLRLLAIAWFVPFQLSKDWIRILRLCRLLRIFPALQGLHVFQFCSLGLQEGLPKLMWITTILIAAVYAFAILFTELVDGSLDYEADFMELYFKDTGTTMLTFWSIATGATWDEIVRPIMSHQCYLMPLMILFMVAVSFGIMNVFTGVITDSVSNVREQSRKAKREDHMKQGFLLWGQYVHQEGLSYSFEGGSELFAENGLPGPVMPDMEGVNEIDKIQDADKRKEQLRRRTVAIRKTCKELNREMKGDEDEDLPFGLTSADFMSILSLEGVSEDVLTLEEFLEGLRRLLFSSQFQRTCLTWRLLQILRRQNVSQAESAHCQEAEVLGILKEMQNRLEELSLDSSTRPQQ